MAFNAEKYQELLRKAIGSRSQKDFAKISGLSPFNLNRMLNDDVSSISVPRKLTLHKIAESSEGRVTEAQLLDVCGYEIKSETVIQKDNRTAEEKNFDVASRYRNGLEKVAGNAMKYASLEDFFETIALTDGVKPMLTKVLSETEFTGSGHLNAEYMAHCITIWRYEGYDSNLYFTVFFCKTQKDGVIISDVVFDLDTLNDLHHDKVGSFLFSMAEKGDLDYGDFPMVFMTKKHIQSQAELRLLKAIFGEDFDGSTKKEENDASCEESESEDGHDSDRAN